MDLTAALLAEAVGADLLLIFADITAVLIQSPMSEGTPLHSAPVRQLRKYDFAAGSMVPKVAAACRFVWHTNRVARIEQAAAVLAGTVVLPT